MTTLSAELVAHPSSPSDAIRRLVAGIRDGKAPGHARDPLQDGRRHQPGQAACGRTCTPPRRSLATYLLRGVPAARWERQLSRVQFRAVRRLGGLPLRRPPPRSHRTGYAGAADRVPPPAGWLQLERTDRDRGAARARAGGARSPQDSRPSSRRPTAHARTGRLRTAARSRISTTRRHSRFACRRDEIRHRSPAARPRAARAARRPARRAARASGLGHGRSHALARRARRARGHPPHRRVRAAARPARRQAGQHGRVAGLHRSGARHPGVQPLRRGAPADRRR